MSYVDVCDLVSELKRCLLSFLVCHLLPTHVKCRGLLLYLATLGRPSGRVIGPSQRSLHYSTQHSQATDIHPLSEIRTRYLSKRAVADPRIRHRGHGDRRRNISELEMEQQICWSDGVLTVQPAGNSNVRRSSSWQPQ
jgi:hypothetical protein